MIDWFFHTQGWMEFWSQALWRVLWQGGLALILVWMVCRFVPGLPARVRCWLWRLAYLKLVVAFFWADPVLLPVLSKEREPEPTALIQISSVQSEILVAEEITPAGLEIFHSYVSAEPEELLSIKTPAPLTRLLEPQEETNAFLSGWTILLMLWLAGVLVIGWGQLLEWRRLRNMVRTSRLIQRSWLKDELNQLCQALGLSTVPRLLMGRGLSSPVLVGVIRPDILIPESWVNNLEHGQGRMMLAHELVHLKRRDLVWNWLPAVARTLFFFQPLVWIFLKEWRLAQEMACDEQAVLAGRVSPADYGGMLVSVVTRCFSTPTQRISHFSAGILESKETLQRRLKAMKVIRSLSFPRLVLWTSVTFCVGSLVLVPWRLTAQEPETLESPPSPEELFEEKLEATEVEEVREVREVREVDDLFSVIQKEDNTFSQDEASDFDELFPPDQTVNRKKRSTRKTFSERRGSASDDEMDDVSEDPFAGGDDRNYDVHRYTTKSPDEELIRRYPDDSNIEVLKAEFEAAQAELELSEHRFNRMHELKGKNVVSEEEVVKAHAELARSRAYFAKAKAQLKGGERMRSYNIQRRTYQVTDKDRTIEALRQEVESLKRQLQQKTKSSSLLGQQQNPFADSPNTKRIEIRRFENTIDDGHSSPKVSVREEITTAVRISQEQWDQERELIDEEIDLAVRQLSLQQERYEAGQVSEDQILALRREILSLKRQKIRLGTRVSTRKAPVDF